MQLTNVLFSSNKRFDSIETFEKVHSIFGKRVFIKIVDETGTCKRLALFMVSILLIGYGIEKVNSMLIALREISVSVFFFFGSCQRLL